MSVARREELSVYHFLDYREFLKAFYEIKKEQNSGYSHRVFAQRAGLKSPNYLKLVMDGQRRITDRNLSQFLRGLDLSGKEAKYFKNLVSFQELEDPNEKQQYLHKLVSERAQALSKTHEIEGDQVELLKHWYHLVVFEMVLLKDFEARGEWISSRLKRRVSPQQAEESLQLLQRLGYLREANGRLCQAEPQISTVDEVVNALVKDLHRQLINLGLLSLHRNHYKEREFSGLTIALSESQLQRFKEKIKEFRKELNAEFSLGEEEKDQVYQYEMMLFPITERSPEC